MIDARQSAPAAARNRDPILSVLREVLPTSGTVLEVASGTGEHGVHFAHALPGLEWQPSDPDPVSLASIEAWRVAEGGANLRPPLCLDASAFTWPLERADAIVCINMVHISPWEATIGLMAGASRLLVTGSPLVLYGPYQRSGEPLEPSNAAFDQSLRQRDPRWGVRLLEDVRDCAQAAGLELERVLPMPANNLTLVFRRR